MTNKWQGYVLNVQGIVCWRKTINEDNQEVFIKAMIDEPFELYIEKLKEKLKDMNTSGNSIDVVTGRVFKIIEQEESIMLLPSCIAMNKNSMIKHHDVFTKCLCVLKAPHFSAASFSVIYSISHLHRIYYSSLARTIQPSILSVWKWTLKN